MRKLNRHSWTELLTNELPRKQTTVQTQAGLTGTKQNIHVTPRGQQDNFKYLNEDIIIINISKEFNTNLN